MQTATLNGALNASFFQAFNAGCIQTGADTEISIAEAYRQFSELFRGLRFATDGNICAGCPVNVRQCVAHALYYRTRTAELDKSELSLETVRQEAKRRDVSISQVRRERQSR